jgi:F0F1-type ATP synthase assembly protein I
MLPAIGQHLGVTMYFAANDCPQSRAKVTEDVTASDDQTEDFAMYRGHFVTRDVVSSNDQYVFVHLFSPLLTDFIISRSNQKRVAPDVLTCYIESEMTRNVVTHSKTKTTNHADASSVPALIIREFADTTWRIVVPVLLFVIVGILLDRWLGTKPWLTLIGMVIGFFFAALLIKRQIGPDDETEDHQT